MIEQPDSVWTWRQNQIVRTGTRRSEGTNKENGFKSGKEGRIESEFGEKLTALVRSPGMYWRDLLLSRGGTVKQQSNERVRTTLDRRENQGASGKV